MSVKSERSGKSHEGSYPFLGTASDGKIVLFSEKSRGIVVADNNRKDLIGTYSGAWAMDEFAYYTGKITLSNEE